MPLQASLVKTLGNRGEKVIANSAATIRTTAASRCSQPVVQLAILMTKSSTMKASVNKLSRWKSDLFFEYARAGAEQMRDSGGTTFHSESRARPIPSTPQITDYIRVGRWVY
ncbi:hypothetical protein V9T40_005137 [Parthenolecanium corni]|uniref:Uncharacterized protein n=1 Tax=Parthenolecanium corni TaxID=536013 RepID=A0AAN9THD5_9HEMI